MKKTLAILFAAVLAVCMCVPSLAFTLDTAELAADETTEAVEYVSLAADEVIPGINLLTGTTEPETFDGSTTVPENLSFSSYGKASVTTTKVSSGTNSLECVSVGTYPKVYFNVPVEEGRKYNIRAVATASTENDNYIWWVAQDTSDNKQKVLETVSGFPANATAGTWTKLNSSYTAVSTNVFYFQMKTVSGNVIHYDDISVIPYYKITYIGLDGETVAATDYALVDANGDFLTSYIPDLSKVEGATGYALTAGGERIAEVALENKDIVLYAVDDAVMGLAYGDTYMNVAVDGDSFTFPAAEETFEGIENFFVYSDGESFYKAGDTAAAADVIGKTFTAVCTTYKEFDEKYGELILYTDYDLVGVDTVPGSAAGSGAILPSYKNNDFVPGSISHTDGNAINTADVTYIDGNKVLKLTTKNTNVYNYWSVVLTVADAGKFTAFENVRAEDTQGIDLATQFGTAWHRFNYDSTYKAYNFTSIKPTAEWQTFAVAGFVSATGIKSSGFSYNRASSAMLPNIYKDNHAVYCYPSYTIYFKDAHDSTTYVKDELDITAGNPTTYTFPTPEALGFDAENFAAWTNGSKYYAAGEETAIANVQYTVFYPFYQTKDAPAMGFTFEGDIQESAVEVSNPIYTENIVDDGRDVLLVHWFKGNGGKDTAFPTDLRLSFKTSTYSDPSEYNIVQYSVKATNAWSVKTENSVVVRDDDGNALYTALTSKNFRIFAHTTAGGVYTSPVIQIANTTINMSDSYNILEYDLSSNESFTSKAGYGFCIDPLQATYGAYVYMDYLRVYRKGAQTITYDTNAPEGAAVVTEVAADTNRGLGYGYLLKDERPEVEGYVFRGWALTSDSTETVNSITVDGNETVYAVWTKAESAAAPTMTTEVEIKGTGTNNGIRFKSEITPSVKENLDEFGFLATREVLLPYADEEKTIRDHEYLTFLHKVNGANANYYVQGVAYDADGGIDLINSENTDGDIVYTAVVSGIPLENKNEIMVVRPYAKYTVNGKEIAVYGSTASASLYETAKAIEEAGGAAYENNKEYITSIVG